MASDYISFDTPTNTDALHVYCDAGRDHHHKRADILAVTAADLQNKLRKSLPGSPMLFGMDSAAVARRITKHLKYAAELNATSARAFLLCWAAYEQYVLNASEANVPFKV